MEPAILTKGLCKKVGLGLSRVLVDQLDLRVEIGQIFGILGPNGAGKTTTFKLLLGLCRPTSGEAFLFGVPITDDRSRKGVGYLPETINHPDYLTVQEYLLYHGKLAGLDKLNERIKARLARVGMAGSEHLSLGTLSKGMKQRVDLARVLMLDARLILLDEPVSGLDPLGQADLKRILLDLRREGISFLINSHSIGILAEVCDVIGIMAEGRLLTSGPIASFLDTGFTRFIVRGRTDDPLPLLPDRCHEDRSARTGDSLWHIDLANRPDFRPVLKAFVEAELHVDLVQPIRRTLEEVFSNYVIRPREKQP